MLIYRYPFIKMKKITRTVPLLKSNSTFSIKKFYDGGKNSTRGGNVFLTKKLYYFINVIIQTLHISSFILVYVDILHIVNIVML